MGKSKKVFPDIIKFSKLELKEWIKVDNLGHFKTKKCFYKNRYPELYQKIIEFSTSDSWPEQIYNYINDIKENPKCKICSNVLHLNRYHDGYHIYCSNSCARNDLTVINKLKETIFNKYGVEYISQNSEILKKILKTKIDKGYIRKDSQEIRKNEKIARNNNFSENIINFSKEELKKWFDDNVNGYKTKEKWLANHYAKIYEKIIENTSSDI